MNQEAFQAGKAAYQQGNLVEAVSQLVAAKQPGEVSGQIDHLLGNCYMRLGRYDRFTMDLPHNRAFRDASLQQASQDEIAQIEQGK